MNAAVNFPRLSLFRTFTPSRQLLSLQASGEGARRTITQKVEFPPISSTPSTPMPYSFRSRRPDGSRTYRTRREEAPLGLGRNVRAGARGGGDQRGSVGGPWLTPLDDPVQLSHRTGLGDHACPKQVDPRRCGPVAEVFPVVHAAFRWFDLGEPACTTRGEE